MIDVPGMWPQRLAGGTVYRGKDFKLRNGDLVLGNRDLVMVEGVQALAQAIELGIRRQFAQDTDAEPIASQFLDFLRSSRFSDHLQELTTVRYIEDQIEYEFRATGFSGAYVHRFGVRGFVGSHDCIPVRCGDVVVVDALDARLLVELSADPSSIARPSPT